MLEKLTVLLVVFALVLAYDIPRLKRKQKRERLAYGALMLLALYFSADFLSRRDFPDMHMLVDRVLSGPAKQIVGYLKAGAS